MQTEESTALIRERSGVAETPNAEFKTCRAMDPLLVRGIQIATSVVLLSAIVYNRMHFDQALIGSPVPSIENAEDRARPR